MTFPIMIPWEQRDQNRPWPLRIRTRIAICAARLLVRLPPHRLRRALEQLRQGARPATFQEAEAAKNSVLSASLSLNALRACLPRSVAVALLCRMSGYWPTWCTGVPMAPPFTAHAWVEVDGQPVGEYDNANWARMIVVSPASTQRSR